MKSLLLITALLVSAGLFAQVKEKGTKVTKGEKVESTSTQTSTSTKKKDPFGNKQKEEQMEGKGEGTVVQEESESKPVPKPISSIEISFRLAILSRTLSIKTCFASCKAP